MAISSSNSTTEILTPAAVSDSDLRDLSRERREGVTAYVAAELFRPRAFLGCLGTDGSYRRYTVEVSGESARDGR